MHAPICFLVLDFRLIESLVLASVTGVSLRCSDSYIMLVNCGALQRKSYALISMAYLNCRTWRIMCLNTVKGYTVDSEITHTPYNPY